MKKQLSKNADASMKDAYLKECVDINDKSLLLGICEWITRQPEYKDRDVTDEGSLFYYVAPIEYAKLILRFVRENKSDLETIANEYH
jgi:hypothetical protein